MRVVALVLLLAACASGRDEEPADPLERAIRGARSRRTQHIEDAERIDDGLAKVRHDLPRLHGEERANLHRKLAMARAEIDEHMRLATVELRVTERLVKHRGQKLSTADVEALHKEIWLEANRSSKLAAEDRR